MMKKYNKILLFWTKFYVYFYEFQTFSSSDFEDEDSDDDEEEDDDDDNNHNQRHHLLHMNGGLLPENDEEDDDDDSSYEPEMIKVCLIDKIFLLYSRVMYYLAY